MIQYFILYFHIKLVTYQVLNQSAVIIHHILDRMVKNVISSFQRKDENFTEFCRNCWKSQKLPEVNVFRRGFLSLINLSHIRLNIIDV